MLIAVTARWESDIVHRIRPLPPPLFMVERNQIERRKHRVTFIGMRQFGPAATWRSGVHLHRRIRVSVKEDTSIRFNRDLGVDGRTNRPRKAAKRFTSTVSTLRAGRETLLRSRLSLEQTSQSLSAMFQ